MAKKRLTNQNREQILTWMLKEKISAEPTLRIIEKKIDKLCDLINPIVRKKYPEEDMVILRKYDYATKERVFKFNLSDCGRVFAVNFGGWSKLTGETTNYFINLIVDTPYNTHDIYEGTLQIERISESITEIWDKFNKEKREKEKQYKSFLYNCKNLEEVEEIVTLPQDMSDKIRGGGTTAMTIMNPELIKNIKSDFKK